MEQPSCLHGALLYWPWWWQSPLQIANVEKERRTCLFLWYNSPTPNPSFHACQMGVALEMSMGVLSSWVSLAYYKFDILLFAHRTHLWRVVYFLVLSSLANLEYEEECGICWKQALSPLTLVVRKGNHLSPFLRHRLVGTTFAPCSNLALSVSVPGKAMPLQIQWFQCLPG